MFELYFYDLTPDAQERLLKEAGLSRPEDANWDVFPIDTISFPEGE